MADAPGPTSVHPTAIVEDGARVGAGTRIWHHAHVRAGAVIGVDCTIGKNVFVDAGVRIGDRCKLQNNVSVYAGVTLEDEVFVGPAATFTNDRYPRATSTDWEVVPTVVRRGASVGANATVVCGHELGEWSTVAAGAVVTRSLLAHELVAGVPARRVGWVCVCGHVLAHGPEPVESVTCGRCGRRFDGLGAGTR
jgi:UDP-3-O-[3-hydroxymyristoyl] glucosamine N-acyltransferase